MDKYELDLSRSCIRSVPNDVYYIILGESPLDEENWAVADRLSSEFENGFDIRLVGENESVPGELLVKIIPYKKAVEPDCSGYDMACSLTTAHVMLLRLLDKGMLGVYELDKRTGVTERLGTVEIKTNEYGLEYFELGSEGRQKSVFYLNRFAPVK